ncbi:hypothetical protein BTVI_152182 [Pitangus sulphuratus]|nr:hypothetical protein BTVI_152182 [Pitangus sulphuratus]
MPRIIPPVLGRAESIHHQILKPFRARVMSSCRVRGKEAWQHRSKGFSTIESLCGSSRLGEWWDRLVLGDAATSLGEEKAEGDASSSFVPNASLLYHRLPNPLPEALRHRNP